MRDVVVFALFMVILPMSFVRPWLGICAFTFLAYNRTQDLTWGFARDLPISQFIAIAMVIGWLTVEFRPLPLKTARVKALLGLSLAVTLSILMNTIRWGAQGHRYSDLLKVMFVAVLTGALLVNRERLRTIMAIMAVALGFYGAKNGLLYILGSKSISGPGGMLKDNNDFALAMVMNLPLLVYLATEAKTLKHGKYIFLFMRAAAGLSLLAIMSTGSRGALLSLGVCTLLMAWKTKYKVPALAGLFLVGVLGIAVAPKEYKDRIASMFVKAEEQDDSVKGRFTSWKVATTMIKRNPIWGIGFENMVFEYNNYTDGIYNEQGTTEQFARVAHNSYFQIWAESGTIAYVLFMFMLFGSIVCLEQFWRRCKGTPDEWVIPYCNAIQVSMCAYAVGAIFLNRAHFDFIYQLVVIAAVLPAIVKHEAQHRHKTERRAGPRLAQDVQVTHGDAFLRMPVR
jgi:probable O-glycosylation ligase (exosortase A-associated)